DADPQRRIADLREGSRIADSIVRAHYQHEMKVIPVTPAVALRRHREIHRRLEHGIRGKHLPKPFVRQCLTGNLIADVRFDLSTSGISEGPNCHLAAEVDRQAPPSAVVLDPTLDATGQRDRSHLWRRAQREFELLRSQRRFQYAEAVALPFR